MTTLPTNHVAALFEAAAQTHSRKNAVADRLQHVTYGSLRRRANQLAHQLVYQPLQPGDVVGIALGPSCDFAIALLAVWKAGAIAMPMDPDYPPARIGRLLDDAGCRYVVTTSSLAETIRGCGAVGIYLDAVRMWIDRQPHHAPHLSPHRLACLMYTSGSTGRPKGVEISHQALVNKLTQPGAWGAVASSCRAAWHSSPAFDASLAQLLLPLVHGGSVRAIGADERLDPHLLWRALRSHRTNVLDCTPSWLMAMLDDAPSGLALKRIVMGGEILTPALARRVRARFPTARLVNVYGPTEACIDATAHEIELADLDADTIPIGCALPGYRIEIMDDALQPVAAGSVGELCIGGVGLADGYWRQPDATAARFVRDPNAPHERLYRTSDLARRRLDGAIEFLGRSDQQIKLRGQRVELGEIEALLTRLPGVTAGVVGAWPSPHQDAGPMIVAHAVLGATTVTAVREQLRVELPAFMVPAVIVPILELPLLPNGKIDRSRLPPPSQVAAVTHAEPHTTDALERDLLKLWQQVLGVRCNVHDNFFELGGDSLRAVDLMVSISSEFHLEVPLGTLLAHPTVADLALVLARGESVQHDGGRVVRLGGGRNRQALPMFLLPPGSGVGLVYAGLAREVADCMPCHALQAIGLHDAGSSDDPMDQLASCLADDIVRLQPSGDIRLSGYSAGGAVAFAIVNQLAQRGRDVDHLVLLDPYCSDEQLPTDTLMHGTEHIVWRNHCGDMLWDALGLRGAAAEPLLRAAERLVELGLARAGAASHATVTVAHRALAQVRRALPSTTSLDVFLLLLEGVTTLGAAYARYQIAPLQHFSGRSWIVQPDADSLALRETRRARWQSLVGAPLHAHVVPGEHATLLQRSRSVSAIGELLRQIFSSDNDSRRQHAD